MFSDKYITRKSKLGNDKGSFDIMQTQTPMGNFSWEQIKMKQNDKCTNFVI